MLPAVALRAHQQLVGAFRLTVFASDTIRAMPNIFPAIFQLTFRKAHFVET
jgi:hypothetical protein